MNKFFSLKNLKSFISLTVYFFVFRLLIDSYWEDKTVKELFQNNGLRNLIIESIWLGFSMTICFACMFKSKLNKQSDLKSI